MLRDLRAKIPGAPNFTYGELIKSSTARRLGISNIPNEEQWLNLGALAVEVLQPIRYRFGRIRITSGFRCPKLCLAIGSSINSNHTRGEASDIEPLRPSVTLMDVTKFVYRNLEFRELILEYPPDGWVHIAFRIGDNSRYLKLKDANHNYERVTLNYIVGKYSNIY